jgi:predicted esterase
MRGDTEICAARSTDEGRNWEMLGNVPRPEGVLCEQCHEPHVLELKDGSLLGVVRVELPFRTMVTRSTDGGKTWSVMEEVGAHGAPPHLLRHSSGAIVCVYGYRQQPFGQRCMISYDEGKTWKADIIIRDDGPNGDLGYPASVELSDGSILTIYYQFRANQGKASILWTKWNLPVEGDKSFNTETLEQNEFELHRRYFFDDCECRIYAAPNYDPKSGKVALTFSGRGNTPLLANVDAPEALEFRRKLLSEGYMIIIPFCGGNSWGNADATTKALKSLEHLKNEAGFAIPQKMPVFGYSMGGLAALMFAVRHPERVSKIVDFFGAIDLADMAKRNAAFAPVINSLYPDEAALQAASPLNYGKILAQFPIRIYHGDKDQGVPMSYSTRLETLLKENGGKVDLVVVPEVGHENAIMKHMADDFIDFLKKQ